MVWLPSGWAIICGHGGDGRALLTLGRGLPTLAGEGGKIGSLVVSYGAEVIGRGYRKGY